MKLWTIGYAGHDYAWLSRTLRSAGVKVLIDVRLDTRRIAGHRIAAGFEAGELERALDADGLIYTPVEAAGNPYRTGLFDDCMRSYRKHLQRSRGVDLVAGVVREAIDSGRRPCLLCACPNADWCHRNVLAGLVVEALAATHPIELVHLPVRVAQAQLFGG